MRTIKTLLAVTVILFSACQKDYYLEDLEAAQSEINALQNQLAQANKENQERVNTLNTEVSHLETLIVSLEDALSTSEAELATSQEEIALHLETIALLTEEIITLEENVLDLMAQLEAKQNSINSLESELVSESISNDSYTAQVASLKQEIAALTIALNEAQAQVLALMNEAAEVVVMTPAIVEAAEVVETEAPAVVDTPAVEETPAVEVTEAEAAVVTDTLEVEDVEIEITDVVTDTMEVTDTEVVDTPVITDVVTPVTEVVSPVVEVVVVDCDTTEVTESFNWNGAIDLDTPGESIVQTGIKTTVTKYVGENCTNEDVIVTENVERIIQVRHTPVFGTQDETGGDLNSDGDLDDYRTTEYINKKAEFNGDVITQVNTQVVYGELINRVQVSLVDIIFKTTGTLYLHTSDDIDEAALVDRSLEFVIDGVHYPVSFSNATLIDVPFKGPRWKMTPSNANWFNGNGLSTGHSGILYLFQ